jgi:hypothetical protein
VPVIFPVALKTVIIKYKKYNFKQYIHIHNKISQSEYNEYNVIIIRSFVLTLIRHLYEEEKNQHAYSDGR